MKEQKETELEKWAASHITVSERPFQLREDDPFLIKKLEDAEKSLKECPPPEWLLKRMDEEE